MAEAALGLALGVPGFIDVLIKTCLEGYQFISTARSADEDFENHRYQFRVEQQKLKDLTTTVASRIRESTLKTDDVRFLLISSMLTRIAQQFSDFRRLESLYGVRISSSNKSVEKPSRRSRIRKVFGLEASQVHRAENRSWLSITPTTSWISIRDPRVLNPRKTILFQLSQNMESRSSSHGVRKGQSSSLPEIEKSRGI
ncbi:hypothetical protein FPQ18DRAFT_48784 [Pyronema domesticum]|nr:hypothetical protein FPQ18DRAFT_48784 [Pyronema domesticum]